MPMKLSIIGGIVSLLLCPACWLTASPYGQSSTPTLALPKDLTVNQLADANRSGYLPTNWQAESPILPPATGTLTNFEGPTVRLKGIRFHEEFLTQQDQRLIHLDAVSAHFDPDHPYYGLPDVLIRIQDVRPYLPEQEIQRFLASSSRRAPGPYRSYRKQIRVDGRPQELEMQLWLTEFSVTIDVRPDQDVPLRISSREKQQTFYPGYWYGSDRPQVPLGELGREYQDFRYGQLAFILEVIPNAAPVYWHTPAGQQASADFAIAAVYCQQAQIGNEPRVQRISTNIQAGQAVFLNHRDELDKMNTNLYHLPTLAEEQAQLLLERRATRHDPIWNQPYYLKLFFNNLGSWRSGLFHQQQYHDQVTYRFLMPVLVSGQWEVMPPAEVLADWTPPEPYIHRSRLRQWWSALAKHPFGRSLNLLLIGLVLGLSGSFLLPLLFRGLRRWAGLK